MALTRGTVLGAFEITGQLGVGGMGEVYRARDTRLGRDIAIKTLPSAVAEDTDWLARFEREARLLASLNHAHIASVHSLDEHEGALYIAMELIEGETLEEKLKSGRLTVEAALQLGLQIALGLEAAHEKGVVHRDLKPANVMVTSDGVVKVLDFGLAKAVSIDPNTVGLPQASVFNSGMTRQGLVLGTAGYMSPEQARGEFAGQRADIWAFGVVLFEMLSGAPTFRGSTLTDIQASVLKSDPDWTALPARLHPRVRMLLERCLAKDARQRYAGISDARVDLQTALADPDGVLPYSRSSPSRPSVAPWAAGVVLAAIAAVAAWKAKPVPGPLVTQFEVVTLGTLPEEGATIALSPDRRHLVYPANDRLYLRSLDRPDRTAAPIPGTEDGANPFFSPDSQWIGLFTGTTLAKVNLTTDERVVVADVAEGWSGEWSEDGRIFFSRIGESGIWWVPELGGVAREFIPLGGNIDLDHPEILPGSSWMLLSERTGDESRAATINVVAIATDGSGDRREIMNASYKPRYVASGHLLYVQDGALWAVGFDAASLDVTTDPFRIVDAVSASATGPRASYSLAEDGSIAFVEPPLADDPLGLLALIDMGDGSREYLGLGPAQYRNPRFSPDGSRILFETIEADGRSTVWLFRPDTRTRPPDRLTIAGSNTRPLWQDDERVLYASDREGALALYSQSIVTRDAERLLEPLNESGDCPVSWDADRRLLFFGRQGCLVVDTWVTTIAADGSISDPEPLANVGYGAEISPNKAYVASFPGPNPVEVRRFPVTDEVWRIGTGGAYPIWSPDGESMIYRRASQIPGRSAAVDRLARVTVSTGRSFGQLSEETLPIEGFTPNFGYRDYDFAPDGRLLLVVHADPNYARPEPGITVVLNWVEVLKQRVQLR